MIRKGAADAVKTFIAERGGSVPAELELHVIVQGSPEQGGTPVVLGLTTCARVSILLKNIARAA